jgi:hypothetical protein
LEKQFKIVLTGDSSGLTQAVKSSENSIESLKTKLATLRNSLKDGLSVDEFKKVQAEIKNVEATLKQVQQTATQPTNLSLRTELREATQTLTEMKLRGEEASEAYLKLSQRAASIRDSMGDVQREIQGAASDTRRFDTALQGMQGVAGVFQIGAGAAALFGAKNEDLAKALIKLNGVMAVTQGLQQVGNLLQKESLVVQAVAAARTKLITFLTAQQAKATATATIAQTALNVAMRLNPVGILLTAITAIAGAIYYFTSQTSRNTEAAKKNAEALEAQKKAAAEWKKELAESAQSAYRA